MLLDSYIKERMNLFSSIEDRNIVNIICLHKRRDLSENVFLTNLKRVLHYTVYTKDKAYVTLRNISPLLKIKVHIKIEEFSPGARQVHGFIYM